MQTIGERLEEARKKKGVSIREAAESTKIRGDYLQKFESNQFDIGLTEIYTRGFLRTYSGFLKLPVDRIMSDYAALGRGELRPRQPSREVYGRMDISVASAAEASDRAAPPSESSAPEPVATAKPQAHHPRGTGSSLPTGPDPAVVFKWVKIGGGVLGLILLVVVIKMLFSGGSTAPSARPTASTPAPAAAATPTAPAERSIGLIAANPVHVKVQRKNPDESYGEVLFDAPMNRGESRLIPWRGPIYITATASENLILEINGRRTTLADATHQTGYATGQLPGP